MSDDQPPPTPAPDEPTAVVPALSRGRTRKLKTTDLLEVLRTATLGEYDVAGELGRGGMATVFLAHDIALDRKVAIKVMSPELLIAGDQMVERFLREARTGARLSHPNIIPIYAVRETEELIFFVMKFVEGKPLDDIIKGNGPLPFAMVRRLISQVADALGYAHRSGIIHRDIKPANVMVDKDGWVLVTDLGIAKVQESSGLTSTGSTVGTPAYMSPEQAEGAKDITGATDQYALGIVAYEMLTGRPPFDADTVMALMWKHHTEAPPPVTQARADTPPDLAAAIARMLSKKPGDRFPTMDEVVKAFRGTDPVDEDEERAMVRAFVAGEVTPGSRFHTPKSPPVVQPLVAPTAVENAVPGPAAPRPTAPPRPVTGGAPSGTPTAGKQGPPVALLAGGALAAAAVAGFLLFGRGEKGGEVVAPPPGPVEQAPPAATVAGPPPAASTTAPESPAPAPSAATPAPSTAAPKPPEPRRPPAQVAAPEPRSAAP
ncbi:MAG: serine/threonine-protein kinase, partial [Gemmatimonadales bacterium]|nr:serine/threonine-protein kinase [Gemmatimonadales bacterium]